MLGASRICSQISVVQASLIGELAKAVVEGVAEGGAVLERRNLESVFDHVDVFAGHEDDKETDDGKNRFAIGPRANDGCNWAADERNS